MKLNQFFLIGLLIVIFSCKFCSDKTDLSNLMSQLKELGGFENADYKFIGVPNNRHDGGLIKVNFQNSRIEHLDLEKFAKESAKKIFNYDGKTRQYGDILVTIENKEYKRSKKMNLGSITTVNIVNTYSKEKNFHFKASELK